jgi:hypothetical protein
MDLESLYLLVTEAIMRAEALQDLGAPGAAAAFVDVSLIEEEIAKRAPASDPEGAIARRGAVRAAVFGGDVQRARRLVDRFLQEEETEEVLRRQLVELLDTARKAPSVVPAAEEMTPPSATGAPRPDEVGANAGSPEPGVAEPLSEPSATDDLGLRRWVNLQRVAAGLPPLGDGPDVPARSRGALRVSVGRDTMAEVLSRSA